MGHWASHTLIRPISTKSPPIEIADFAPYRKFLSTFVSPPFSPLRYSRSFRFPLEHSKPTHKSMWLRNSSLASPYFLWAYFLSCASLPRMSKIYISMSIHFAIGAILDMYHISFENTTETVELLIVEIARYLQEWILFWACPEIAH